MNNVSDRIPANVVCVQIMVYNDDYYDDDALACCDSDDDLLAWPNDKYLKIFH